MLTFCPQLINLGMSSFGPNNNTFLLTSTKDQPYAIVELNGTSGQIESYFEPTSKQRLYFNRSIKLAYNLHNEMFYVFAPVNIFFNNYTSYGEQKATL